MTFNKFIPYGIRFKPIVKDKIWGGPKLKNILKKSASNLAGESWEISTVEDNFSVVENGIYKGINFKELLEKFPFEILGESVVQIFDKDFPLLIKFIDASKNLSVQVHPDDKMARKYHDSYGKTEMWYVMQADNDAEINVGWKNRINAEQYRKSLKDGTITDHLNFFKVSEGDTFYIQAGKVHAIGAGVMLAEIQQTSDITYRVYDWDRVDSLGKSRDLHIDKAEEAINFDMKDDHSVHYNARMNETVNLVDSPFFKTNIIEIENTFEKDYSSVNSFVIYMCVKGSVVISVNNTEEILEYGQTILIPAKTQSVIFKGDFCKILEVFIQ